MEIFLVGGSVRDFLLAKQEHKLTSAVSIQQYWDHVEKDWVVVGATAAQMLALGFKQVGKSFPVFLHPTSHEEYALARTERKIGKGYTGFECYAETDVTLEEDLMRRDLTINAIAMRFIGDSYERYEIIDPTNGQQDLKNKVFCHIANAFIEDPVRILRVARFASRFGEFQIAASTQLLMSEMVNLGEVDALVPERVWQEWHRALMEPYPWRFYEVLQACKAAKNLFPEIENILLKNKALINAVTANASGAIRLAIHLFDLPETALRHILQKYRIPNELSDLVQLVAKFYHLYIQLDLSSADQILRLLEQLDAFRRQKRFKDFIVACELINHNQQITTESQKATLLQQALQQIVKIDNQELIKRGLKGPEFAQALHQLRYQKIEVLLSKN